MLVLMLLRSYVLGEKHDEDDDDAAAPEHEEDVLKFDPRVGLDIQETALLL